MYEFLEKIGSKYKDITAYAARHKQVAIGKKGTGPKDTVGKKVK